MASPGLSAVRSRLVRPEDAVGTALGGVRPASAAGCDTLRGPMARTKGPTISAEESPDRGWSAAGAPAGRRLPIRRGCRGHEGLPGVAADDLPVRAGGLTPSLAQFLDLVGFYVLVAPHGDGARPEDDLRARGVAAVTRVLELPAYHVVEARELIARMQPRGDGTRRRSSCSASTTSGSPSRIWRRASRGTSASSARRPSTVSAWRTRGSRRCCSPPAARPSSCWARSGRPPRSAGRSRPVVPASTTWRTGWPTSRRRSRTSSPKAHGSIDDAPRPGSRGTTIAFVHPRSMGGVLVELVQEP